MRAEAAVVGDQEVGCQEVQKEGEEGWQEDRLCVLHSAVVQGTRRG